MNRLCAKGWKINRTTIIVLATIGMNLKAFAEMETSTNTIHHATAVQRQWAPTGQRIIKVEWIPFATHPTGQHSKCFMIARLTTDKGVQGSALFNRHYRKSDEVAAALIGLDPGNPEAVAAYLDSKGFSHRDYTPVDIAVWDLMGRIRGKPVHELLGTQQDSFQPKYSAWAHQSGEAGIQEALKGLGEALQNGFQVCQIHCHYHGDYPPPNNPYATTEAELESDIKMFHELRQVAGPGVELIADCHYGYTVEQAVRIGKVLGELKYRHLESPLPERNSWMERYVELQKQLPIPICAPEILVDDTNWGGTFSSLVRWIEAGAAKHVRLSNKIYGFTHNLWAARLAIQKGLCCEMHNDGDFTFFYDLEILASLDAGHTGQVGCYDVPSQEPKIDPWLKTPTVYLKDGRIPVPKTVGMGVEINWEYVNKNRCAETEYDAQ
jgi:L-alanine-DL-glutamate epimerase-like enolase superfamily enzyme